ncbi:MAG: TIGR03546 family protein [Planctomycetes bacterium]|nr:TIGR03546 family protein [Planctomycetota bacterium]
MFFALKTLRKLYKVIVSETHPWSIGVGFAAGAILGLTPFLGLHTVIIVCAILMFRINLASTLVSAGLFKLPTFLLWGTFHALGESILVQPGAKGAMSTLSNTPVLAYLRLNNTQMLGSLLIACLVAIPTLILGVAFVKKAREVLSEDRRDHWISKAIFQSRIFAILVKLAK